MGPHCQFPAGRLCVSVAREATCVTADVNDRWGFRFENVRLEWLNELPGWKLEQNLFAECHHEIDCKNKPLNWIQLHLSYVSIIGC